uniref:Uncharacterized protein n=1 Tax=Panagrolaimus sp. JU765 TaxID=591449 RepID=A0AC34R9Q5_9BILA
MLRVSKNLHFLVLKRFASSTVAALSVPQSNSLSKYTINKGNFIESVLKFKDELSFLDAELDRLDEQRQKNYQKVGLIR